ncbi:RagB/SusD family nutrient uptake outer membrane protein [Mucilaginibacter sp. McL0603]|uniref:RagB/SusD family nutrient uptake outer membrane protein n=1 Tax=Mucilaginibacter sp. McL0603 TaxID=3415670 RepID=UPI003CEFBF41
MKIHIRYIAGMAAVASMLATSCKKDFFNRPPESGVVVDNYYQTSAQVQASTNGLYGSAWFGWNNKVGWAITEFASGNGRSYSSDVGPFGTPPVPNDNTELLAAWNSPFTVIAQCNGILNNLPTSVPASVPANVVNNALGEAHLMRATAYFYLVRTFGNVPLVENPLQDINNFQTVPTNPISDVYKFIVRDLQFAEANCTPNVASSGHGSSGSASAMLAKVYLYMQDYANAQKEAEKVINSGEFSLLANFGDLFRTINNNNKESILAMQWIYNGPNGGYDYGNSIQASWAFSSAITGTGDGYGVFGPTIDLQNAFKAEGGDTVRRHYTIMLPGSYYSELNKAAGGYTLPLNASSQGTQAEPKKYVIGTPSDPDNNGKTAAQAGGNNTYIMRYADVLLIEAEAILGQSANPGVGHGIALTASTSNATALNYFNMIRTRSGVPAVTSFTYQQLLNERRLEFALEQDYWFDLCRIDGFNSTTHPTAIGIIKNQERGTYNNAYPDQTSINSMKYTFTDAYFLFTVPVAESAADPNLLKAPVPYKF